MKNKFILIILAFIIIILIGGGFYLYIKKGEVGRPSIEVPSEGEKQLKLGDAFKYEEGLVYIYKSSLGLFEDEVKTEIRSAKFNGVDV